MKLPNQENKPRYYAVIDTNVIVSAMLKWQSLPGNILTLVFEGVVVPVFNDEIIREYREVLSRPKFNLSNQIIEDFVGNIEELGLSIKATTLDLDFPDPKDKIFYEITIEHRKSDETYLVTGNIKHFPAQRFVVTPREMLEIISG
ncbi:putative toxin-antitoxin system toxin component, PIN family [bacterium]|nr:putative toxin-antitoxin system toxin component, PIN family [bacterium]